MGLIKQDNQNALYDALQSFSVAARMNYDSHAFEAGYLQSTLVSILPLLPKREQKVLIDDMIRAAQKQEHEVVAKMGKKA
jgi:hypothetical protein